MKIQSTRIIIGLAIFVFICAIVGYFILGSNIAPVIQKHMDVNKEVEYSKNRNEVHELLITQLKGKYGFTDLSGNTILQPTYDLISTADYGLYYVKSGKDQGFLNAKLLPVFMTEETIGTTVSEDFVIYKSGKEYGFINIKTGDKIKAQYEAAYDFSEGLAAVQKNGKIGFINTNGEVTIPHKYYKKGLYYFKAGLCSVIVDEGNDVAGKSFYIDKVGNTVIDDSYDYCMPFYEDMAFVKKANNWFVIDINGKVRTDTVFGNYDKKIPGRFKNGIATVIVNNKYGVINADGEFIVKPQYDELLELIDDKIVFGKDGKYGLMTKNGDVIIEPKFEMLAGFQNSVAVFKNDGKNGLINDKGKVVLENAYQKIEIMDNGLAKVYEDEKIYFYTQLDGSIIWKPDNENK